MRFIANLREDLISPLIGIITEFSTARSAARLNPVVATNTTF